VGSTKGGEEVVQSGLVGQVDDREARAPTVAIAAEEIVIAQRNVK